MLSTTVTKLAVAVSLYAEAVDTSVGLVMC